LIPNQSVVTHAIGLQEAKVSSEIENVVKTNDELAVRSLDVHMFVKLTYCENMSKKTDFLDICQKHVQDVDIFFGGTRQFFGRDINIAPKNSSKWRNPIIAPHKVLRGEGDDGTTVDDGTDSGPRPRPGGISRAGCARNSLTGCERIWQQRVTKSSPTAC
jgi:hypothetical protein